MGRLTANWWAESEEGIVRFEGTTPAQEFGYGDGKVEPTSEDTLMWELLGGRAREFRSPFAASGVEDLTYTKCVHVRDSLDACRR